ncbi:hypothetical protein D3C81_1516910 [compost metagenome]
MQFDPPGFPGPGEAVGRIVDAQAGVDRTQLARGVGLVFPIVGVDPGAVALQVAVHDREIELVARRFGAPADGADDFRVSALRQLGGRGEDAGVKIAAGSLDRTVDAGIAGALAQALADIFAGDPDLDVEFQSFKGLRLNGAGAHRQDEAGEERDDGDAVLARNATLFEHFYLSDHEVYLTEQP